MPYSTKDLLIFFDFKSDRWIRTDQSMIVFDESMA